MTDATVLVTGGTGFLAGHCIFQLARAGYQVRFTVRSLARARDAERAVAAAGVPADSLSFAVADLMSDANWDAAVAGCDYVLHVASPFPRGVPRREIDVIAPARDAVLRVLRAARDAGVRRVVLTSSFAAIGYGHPASRTRPFTEADWTSTASLGVSPYIKSRAIAERAAWDFAGREGGGMELAVINPVGIFGPVTGPDLSGSVGIVRAMLAGDLPRIPRLWTSVVDVRDAADLHLRAMTSPGAAGERFLAASGDAVSYRDIARMLRDGLGPAAARVPGRDLPDWQVRVLSPFVPPLRQFRRNLGVIRHTDAAKARSVLGWEPRPAAEAILATARSLLDLGLAGGGPGPVPGPGPGPGPDGGGPAQPPAR
jgi:dihydroflavonol-4-reductase